MNDFFSTQQRTQVAEQIPHLEIWKSRRIQRILSDMYLPGAEATGATDLQEQSCGNLTKSWRPSIDKLESKKFLGLWS